ncbi:MAG: polysaccharide pyruvyl transferase family protein [bacterium]|nr:polysaccharide pyruvyl transferase family protein [bacterium]
MKRVAIITITNSGLNFGNRLQNYALQESLSKYGIKVETIFSSNECCHSLILSIGRRIAKRIVKNEKRRRKFREFNRKYINNAKKVRYGKINEKIFNNMYDAFIAGSDQVWNPSYKFNSNFEYMAFAPKEKRYSYSASFGVSDIPIEKQASIRALLNDMHAISVREESGAKIVKELTGREAEIHVDPTMLLKKEDYFRMEKGVERPLPEHYLLVYFLGYITDEYRKFIDELANKLKSEVVELSETKGSKFYNIGPQQFLYMIHHANYICTDSFHGSVFSVLFEKPITIFVRKDHDVPTNSRIETLMDKLEIREREFGSLDVNNSIKKINYNRVNELLEEERRSAFKYLKKICKEW